MPANNAPRVGYVLQMYPRISETFILSEILAHEADGVDLEIFSLRAPTNGRFHSALARVRALVTYLPARPGAADFWAHISEAGQELPGLWPALEDAQGQDVGDLYQAVSLARTALSRGIIPQLSLRRKP